MPAIPKRIAVYNIIGIAIGILMFVLGAAVGFTDLVVTRLMMIAAPSMAILFLAGLIDYSEYKRRAT